MDTRVAKLGGGDGFTLIELMIVVAIIALLASIALPAYTSVRLRTKRSELPMNLDGIRLAEKAYESEWDTYTSCAPKPSTVPGRTAVDFGPKYGDNSDWDMLGWMADGKVRGQYEVSAISASSVAGRDFSAVASSDVDGDGSNAVYIADRHTKPTMLSEQSRY